MSSYSKLKPFTNYFSLLIRFRGRGRPRITYGMSAAFQLLLASFVQTAVAIKCKSMLTTTISPSLSVIVIAAGPPISVTESELVKVILKYSFSSMTLSIVIVTDWHKVSLDVALIMPLVGKKMKSLRIPAVRGPHKGCWKLNLTRGMPKRVATLSLPYLLFQNPLPLTECRSHLAGV